jgi:hypothetical protein
MLKFWSVLKAESIRGVVVLGDILRPNPEGMPGGVDGQIGWLHLALRHQVHAACGLAPTLLSPSSCSTLHGLITAERSPAAAQSYWAARHGRMLPRSPIRDLLEERLAGQFCIGYELPPYLIQLLDDLRVPYVDLRVHPIRFLDDLLFGVRPSSARMAPALAEWAVPRSIALNSAGLHEAEARLRPRLACGPGALLVLGQRPGDATQITGGDFFDAMTIREKLHRLCPPGTPILLKDHPSGERHSLVAEVLAARPEARFAETPIYQLLADPAIGRVLTVNSSVAYEAPFFDKPVTNMLPLPVQVAWRGDPLRRGMHATIGDAFLNTDFWRGLLAPYAPVSAVDGYRLARKRNRLRVALGEFWGFRDPDVAAPRPPVRVGGHRRQFEPTRP